MVYGLTKTASLAYRGMLPMSVSTSGSTKLEALKCLWRVGESHFGVDSCTQREGPDKSPGAMDNCNHHRKPKDTLTGNDLERI